MRLFAALLLVAGMAGPAFAREEIISFVADIEVLPDGAMDVTESIKVRAERGQIKRGIYRDFPTRHLRDDGLYKKAGFKVIDVRKNGNPEPYHTELQGVGTRVYIGQKDVFIPTGVYTYTIRYRTTRQLRFFEDHDELYWNVTGNFWNFPIRHAQARVRLAEGTRTGELNAFTGLRGENRSDFRIVSRSDDAFVIETTRPFAPREGLTILATWQKGVVPEPSSAQQMAWLVWDNIGLTVLLFGAILVALYYAYAWSRVGRDPQKGTIIPLFEPPEGVSPAAASYLHFWGFGKGSGNRPLAFMAAIISLAVKGRIRLQQQGKTLMLETTDDQNGPVSPGESAILGRIRGNYGQMPFNKANAKMVASMRNAFRGAISGDYDDRYIRDNRIWFVPGVFIAAAAIIGFFLLQAPPPDQTGPLFFALIGGTFGSVLFLLGLGWLTDLLPGGGSKILGLLYAVIGLVLWTALTVLALNTLSGYLIAAALLLPSISALIVAFFHLLRAPTVAGRELLDRIEGFRLYLSVAEAERMNMAGAPDVTTEVFERFLPYAIGLNVEKPWSNAFESHIAKTAPPGSRDTHYQPDWYGGRSFSSANMAAATGAMVAAMSSSIASATPSSSGSGGGGSSGGGGGGGGGGGW
jgi:hypothetical protein